MNTNIIEGNPTKQFFIEMITRDISVEDAILDLIDNSIDGAININPGDFSGLAIKLRLSPNDFIIEDNCGGFSLVTAKKYAFRFGRPESAPMPQNTIGRFGIGMKRSLFKMGKSFVVETQHQQDHFKVTVDVDTWSKKKTKISQENGEQFEIDDWNFDYEIIDDHQMSDDGTIIHVVELNDEVKDLFNDDSFKYQLKENIKRILNFSLQKGIRIYVNDEELFGQKIDILMSDTVLPYYCSGVYNEVHYKIVAGLGEIGTPKASGWYIYCNNRLVLEADQTMITGWGVENVPKWHNDHVMFRGLLFLDSSETLKLPLTTTKKGIDATSTVYKAMLPIMKNAMQKILPYLRSISQNKGNEANEYRQMLCDTLTHVSVSEIKTYVFTHQERMFFPPLLDSDSVSRTKDKVRIAYDIPIGDADTAKEYTDSKSYKELGLYTFKYFWRKEGLENG